MVALLKQKVAQVRAQGGDPDSSQPAAPGHAAMLGSFGHDGTWQLQSQVSRASMIRQPLSNVGMTSEEKAELMAQCNEMKNVVQAAEESRSWVLDPPPETHAS